MTVEVPETGVDRVVEQAIVLIAFTVFLIPACFASESTTVQISKRQCRVRHWQQTRSA
jgi:hypothetical protein